MLHFRPEKAEYFQIRFKMSGFHGTRGKATIQFYPTASVNGGYISNTPATYDGVYLNSDQYITVTQKIDQAVREMAEAERLVIHFSGFSNPKNDSAYIGGSVTVDYAFIGRKVLLVDISAIQATHHICKYTIPAPHQRNTDSKGDGKGLKIQSFQMFFTFFRQRNDLLCS
jgi:hypothetical protein